MKRRLWSFLLTAALLLNLLAVGAGAQAAAPRVPIYAGDAAVDYMAEEILKEIPTEGLSTRDQIRAVYDWIIGHCRRYGEPSEVYFDLQAASEYIYNVFLPQTQEKLENGQIVLREELLAEFAQTYPVDNELDYDSSRVVNTYAAEMMLYRVGCCCHYTGLLTVLLGHLGIESRMFHGEFINMDGSSVMHAWNYILVDGQYLWADIRIDHATNSHNYFLWEDTEAWAREHTWNHSYSDWLQEREGEIDSRLQAAAQEALGPWGLCSDWARAYMENAGALGLIPGQLDYQDLTAQITRAEFAAVAVRLYESLREPVAPYEGPSPFFDTEDPEVLKAYSLGVVNGMGEGLFAPDGNLTREQAVTMLGRTYELAMLGQVSDGSGLEQGSSRFTDHSAISDYAAAYVYFFAGRSILAGMGDGSFAPKSNMTREQAIKVAAETAAVLG